jgi:predicted transcriptional regulator YheO
MTKTEQIQKIKYDLMEKHGWTTTQAVDWIAEKLHRSPLTIYEYLSVGRANIPQNSLELLKCKL